MTERIVTLSGRRGYAVSLYAPNGAWRAIGWGETVAQARRAAYAKTEGRAND